MYKYRDIRIWFRVTEDEKELIDQNMELLDTSNREAYIRKLVLDGHIINVDIRDAKELVRLLRISSNNLNQVAKRANESGSIYQKDIQELRDEYNRLWGVAEELMETISEFK